MKNLLFILSLVPVSMFSKDFDKDPETHKNEYEMLKVIDSMVQDHNSFKKTDPLTRAWGTFYGLGEIEGVFCVTDQRGNVYLGGNVGDWSTPKDIATKGAYQEKFAGGTDCFIAKFDSNGVRIWGTFYGGTGFSVLKSGAIGPDGKLIVVGETDAAFPVSNQCFQSKHGGGFYDIFVLKLDSYGTREWCTFYGNESWESVANCDVDSDGNILIAAKVLSSYGANLGSLATPGTFRDSAFSDTPSLLIKFDKNGQRKWATFYGGSVSCCSIDSTGNTYIIGTCGYDSTLVTGGTHQDSMLCEPWSACHDIYIAKFNSWGKRLWGTYYGGSYLEFAGACQVDRENNLVVTGLISGEKCTGVERITTPGTHRQTLIGVPCVQVNGIIGKFSDSGKQIWGTYYAVTAGQFSINSCQIDRDNNIVVAGTIESWGDGIQWDICTPDGYLTNVPYYAQHLTLNGFLAKFSSNGQLAWGSLYGGNRNDDIKSCATDNFGNIYIAGTTNSKDTFEIASPGGHDTNMDYGPEAFLAKFSGCDKVQLPPVTDVTRHDNKIVCEGMSSTLQVSYMNNISWHANSTETAVLATGPIFITPTLALGTYSYYAHGKYNCNNLLDRTLVTFSVSACSGLEESLMINAIAVFPNPATRYITVESKYPARVAILNSMGVVIRIGKEIASHHQIDISTIPEGMYHVQVRIRETDFFEKLIVSR